MHPRTLTADGQWCHAMERVKYGARKMMSAARIDAWL